MKNKQMIALGLLMLAAIIVLVVDPNHREIQGDRVGSILLTAEKVNQISAVSLMDKDGGSINLSKGLDGSWTMTPDGFPVDANRLGQFLDSLTQTKILRRVGKDKSSYGPLGLENPGLVTLKIGDQPELELKVGTVRPGGGVYVRTGAAEESYLLDQTIGVQTAEGHWELKSLISLDAKELKVIEFHPAEGSKKETVLLGREAADKKFDVQGLKIDEQKNDPTVDAAESLLTDLQFIKRHPIASDVDRDAMKGATVVTATSFDGVRYLAKVGKAGSSDGEKWYLRISVDGAKDGQLSASKGKALNELGAKWIFEIASFQAGKFDKSRGDFVAPKAKPDAG